MKDVIHGFPTDKKVFQLVFGEKFHPNKDILKSLNDSQLTVIENQQFRLTSNPVPFFFWRTIRGYKRLSNGMTYNIEVL